MITLPAESKATTAAFQSAGAATRLVHSEFTTTQVTAAKASIERHNWHPAAKKYNYAFYFDARRNAISLASNAPETVVAPLKNANPGMIYYHHESEVGFDYSRQDDAAPHWGGAVITPNGGANFCSSGFTAQNVFGARVVVTAGHCFAPGVAVASLSGHYFGVFNNSQYPLYDLATISGSTHQGYIYQGNQLSSAARPVYSGVTTGEQCGFTVISETGTVCTAGLCTSGLYVYRGSGVPSAGGDSGAPFYAVANDGYGAFVRGIHSGRGGADQYAEPYGGITAAYGLTATIAP